MSFWIMFNFLFVLSSRSLTSAKMVQRQTWISFRVMKTKCFNRMILLSLLHVLNLNKKFGATATQGKKIHFGLLVEA